MSDKQNLLRIENIKVSRNGKLVLNIPEFLLGQGEIISFIGPNGAGKSTFLHSVLMLTKFDSGKIYFKNKIISSSSEILNFRRSVSMVFQEPLLFSGSVFYNVASGLKFRGIGSADIKAAVEKYLDMFGISHLRKRNANEISGGEARRVSLARAFALKPELILLDEPFSALDAPIRESLIDDLEKILKETKTSALIATHDRNEAMRLSDKIAVINNGSIEQTSPPGILMSFPVNEFVAGFAGTETILTGDFISGANGIIKVKVNGKIFEMPGSSESCTSVTFCVQPENIIISTGIKGKSSARNNFNGKISKIIPSGFFHKIYIDCGFNLISYITKESLKNLKLKQGSGVFVSIKATSIHIIKTE
jgi:tungstate transport system ATP-binding protein